MLARFLVSSHSDYDVRTQTDKILGFCSLIDRDTLLNEIMTSVEDLVSDQSQHVRAALGTQISGLAPILGKEESVSYVFCLWKLSATNPWTEPLPICFLCSFRCSRMTSLTFVCISFPNWSRSTRVFHQICFLSTVLIHLISFTVIGIELLSQSLLPAIVQLAEDKQWRVRLAIIEYIPLLANQLGVKFFDEQLSDLCMGWLGDTVFSIREAATQNLKKLTEVFGVEWSKESIIPKVMAMGQHPNYLYRMTTCFAISVSFKRIFDLG